MAQPDPRPRPLTVTHAVKRFGSVAALDGVTLSVERGTLVGLLGPNGAGKTTLMKAIAGRLQLDAGEVQVFGRRLTAGETRPEIGLVPQELAIYPLLTATENLEAFGRLYGVPRAELRARVAWALAWCDLADRAREPTKGFSGGMKRRLNIACSLLHRPTLVLLDEPTVGVDPQSRERIYGMLAELQRDGVSIVLTTHHLEEAEQRCERILIIDHGRIVAAGTLAELLQRVQSGTRQARITLTHPVVAPATDGALAFSDDGSSVSVVLDDPGRDLVRAIEAVTAAGGEVAGVALAGATLHDVFIALTGRELRE